LALAVSIIPQLIKDFKEVKLSSTYYGAFPEKERTTLDTVQVLSKSWMKYLKMAAIPVIATISIYWFVKNYKRFTKRK